MVMSLFTIIVALNAQHLRRLKLGQRYTPDGTHAQSLSLDNEEEQPHSLDCATRRISLAGQMNPKGR
jgi:hypothetical protein